MGSTSANPEAAFRFPWLQQLLTRLGWTRPEDIVLPMTMLFLVIVALSTSIRLLLLWVSNRYVFATGIFAKADGRLRTAQARNALLGWPGFCPARPVG